MKDEVTNVLRLVNLVRENVRSKQLFTPDNTILVTLSGGQDSICSLLLLYLLHNQVGLEFHAQTKPNPPAAGATLVSKSTLKIAQTAVNVDTCPTDPDQTLFHIEKSGRLIGQFGLLWCNHFWQKESFHTMLHVAKVNFCFSSTMCFYLPIESVLCEKNAREWRHKSIQRTCAFFHYEYCTQGHTKSDRVETILFNILRGTGIAGLQALRWKKSFYSFSCQRFYPHLSYYTLNLPQPTAPLLKLTQGRYKIGGGYKLCLVNLRIEPTFRLSTKCFYRPKPRRRPVGYQPRRQLELSTAPAAGFARQLQAPPGQPLTRLSAEQEAVTKPKAVKGCRALTRLLGLRSSKKREFASPEQNRAGDWRGFWLTGAVEQPVREQTPKGLPYEPLRRSVRQVLFVREIGWRGGRSTRRPTLGRLAPRGLEHYWLLRELLLPRAVNKTAPA
jgi:hypothetical protein